VSTKKIKFKSLQVISGLTIVVTLAGLFVHFTVSTALTDMVAEL